MWGRGKEVTAAVFLEFPGGLTQEALSLGSGSPEPRCGVKQVRHFLQPNSSSLEIPSPQRGLSVEEGRAGFASTVGMRSDDVVPTRRGSFPWEGEGRRATGFSHLLLLPSLQPAPTRPPPYLSPPPPAKGPSQPQSAGFPGPRPLLNQACLLTRTAFLPRVSPPLRCLNFRRHSPQPPPGPLSNAFPATSLKSSSSSPPWSLKFVCT